MHEWSFKSVSVRSKDHVRSLHQHVEIVAGTTDAKVFAVAFLVVNFAEVTLSILLDGELLGELPLDHSPIISAGERRKTADFVVEAQILRSRLRGLRFAVGFEEVQPTTFVIKPAYTASFDAFSF